MEGRTLFSSIRILPVLILISISSSLKAQTHTPITTIVNSNCGGYWQYLPINYNPATRYPTIVYLHGAGSYGSGSASSLNILLGNDPMNKNWEASIIHGTTRYQRA